MLKLTAWALSLPLVAACLAATFSSRGIERVSFEEGQQILGAACGGHAHTCTQCNLNCAGGQFEFWCPANPTTYVHGSGDKKAITEPCPVGILTCGTIDYVRFCDRDEIPLPPPGGWPANDPH
jgi:hypothetical protein